MNCRFLQFHKRKLQTTAKMTRCHSIELKVNKTAVVSNAQYVDLSSFSLHLEGEKVDVERLISKISSKPTAIKKIQRRF